MALQIGKTLVDTGTIEIKGLTEGKLTFIGYEPQLLDAKITSATARNATDATRYGIKARNVRWILPKD